MSNVKSGSWGKTIWKPVHYAIVYFHFYHSFPEYLNIGWKKNHYCSFLTGLQVLLSYTLELQGIKFNSFIKLSGLRFMFKPLK